jgi:hypothetical protein
VRARCETTTNKFSWMFLIDPDLLSGYKILNLAKFFAQAGSLCY